MKADFHVTASLSGSLLTVWLSRVNAWMIIINLFNDARASMTS